MTTDLPRDMSVSKKISRQIRIVPLILSIGFPLGYLAAILPIDFLVPLQEPLRSTRPIPAVSELLLSALTFYVFYGFLASIPFWLTARHARGSIAQDDLNIYYIRGIVVGLSIVTLAYWFVVGLIAAIAYLDPPGFAQAAAVYVVIAVVVGLLVAFLGWAIGFLYGMKRKHQWKGAALRWHPKNLW